MHLPGAQLGNRLRFLRIFYADQAGQASPMVRTQLIRFNCKQFLPRQLSKGGEPRYETMLATKERMEQWILRNGWWLHSSRLVTVKTESLLFDLSRFTFHATQRSNCSVWRRSP